MLQWDSWTCLHSACAFLHLDVVEYLCNCGGKKLWALVNKKGMTALDVASVKAFDAGVEYLKNLEGE